MSTEPWVTAEHVAQHLGVAKGTVYRWRERDVPMKSRAVRANKMNPAGEGEA